MDSLKQPSGLLAVVSLSLSLGTSAYFNNQFKLLKGDQEKLAKTIGPTIETIETRDKQVRELAKAVNELTRMCKRQTTIITSMHKQLEAYDNILQMYSNTFNEIMGKVSSIDDSITFNNNPQRVIENYIGKKYKLGQRNTNNFMNGSNYVNENSSMNKNSYMNETKINNKIGSSNKMKTINGSIITNGSKMVNENKTTNEVNNFGVPNFISTHYHTNITQNNNRLIDTKQKINDFHP